jgi:hypothetical protein
LFLVALVWLIEHDCVSPVVLMHVAVFVPSGGGAIRGVVAWTTAQLAVAHWNVFEPPAEAIWTTG